MWVPGTEDKTVFLTAEPCPQLHILKTIFSFKFLSDLIYLFACVSIFIWVHERHGTLMEDRGQSASRGFQGLDPDRRAWWQPPFPLSRLTGLIFGKFIAITIVF